MRKIIIWLMRLVADENNVYNVGTKAPISGLYSSLDNKEIIPLAKGEKFPPYQKYAYPWYLLLKV